MGKALVTSLELQLLGRWSLIKTLPWLFDWRLVLFLFVPAPTSGSLIKPISLLFFPPEMADS